MTLLSDVVSVLEREEIPHALVGAAAMALHGVSRATADVDLFTVDEKTLHTELWKEIEQKGATLRLLKGDIEDPLAGSVRLSRTGDTESQKMSVFLRDGSTRLFMASEASRQIRRLGSRSTSERQHGSGRIYRLATIWSRRKTDWVRALLQRSNLWRKPDSLDP